MSTNLQQVHRNVIAKYREMRDKGLLDEDSIGKIDSLLFNPAKNVERYKTDISAFAREVLHFDPAPYQEDVFRALVEHRRVCVRGPHGMGKSSLSAVIVLWFIATHEECKIPTTASAWRQLVEFLWPEIHKWAVKGEWWKVGLEVRPGKELLAQSLELGKNRFAFALSSSDESKIEGAHSEAILYVFDEAKTIPPAIWDAAEGALSIGDAYALAVSTPGESVGRFYDIQMKKEGFEDWHTINVTKDQAISAGRMSKQWAEQRAKAWGEKSVLYQRRVEGNFAEDESDTVITLAAIEKAQERWRALERETRDLIASGKSAQEAEMQVWGPLTHIGVDPARFGADKTGYAFRHGRNIRRVLRTDREDTMETTGRVKQMLDGHNAIALIDTNGLGAGVYDRLHEQECDVVSIMVSQRTTLRDRTGLMQFHTFRDWLWWNMREMLMDEESTVAIPPDDTITQDLIAAKVQYLSSGKILISSKDDMKKILGRSPDAGEAIIYSYAPEAPPYKPLIGFV